MARKKTKANIVLTRCERDILNLVAAGYTVDERRWAVHCAAHDPHEDSYAEAFPFDKLAEGMLNPQMIEDTVQLIRESIRREKRIAIIINSRGGGNGPLIAQQIAKRFLDLQG